MSDVVASAYSSRGRSIGFWWQNGDNDDDVDKDIGDDYDDIVDDYDDDDDYDNDDDIDARSFTF